MATMQTHGLETAKGGGVIGWGKALSRLFSDFATCNKTAGTIFRAYLFDLLALLRMLSG